MDKSLRLQLTILPPTLVVAQLTRADVEKAAYALLNVLILEREISDGDRFVSVTDTGNEISLILDEANAACFQRSGVIAVSGIKYKAFQVAGEGALGFCASPNPNPNPTRAKTEASKFRHLVDSNFHTFSERKIYSIFSDALTGIVQSISEPLAQANISIFYLSTFETDFVFVPVEHVLLAVSVLQQRFSVQVEGYDEAELPAQEPPPATRPDNAKRHPLCVAQGNYHLASLSKDRLDVFGTVLLRLLFKPPMQHVFFSYTETSTSVSDEISMILDKNIEQYIPEDLVNLNTDSWKLIRVGENALGFEEAGIVSSISATLASAQISLFYVSTFQTDYCLVQESDFDLALATLKQAGYVIKG